MTREQIEQQLRADNPTTTDDAGTRHGPGSAVYEARIAAWAERRMAELDAIAAREAEDQADAQRRQQIRDVLDDLDSGEAGNDRQRLRRVELTLAAVIRHIIRNT
jgi:hypothetical protein